MRWIGMAAIATVLWPLAGYAQQPETQAEINPIQVMRDCVYRNSCVVERLEDAPRSERSLPYLIEGYRALANHVRSNELMLEYLRLFPEGRRATQYRRSVQELIACVLPDYALQQLR